MLNEREDQASGLRRLFRRAPPTVVAMYTCGRAPRRLAARTLLELSRRSPRVLVLDEGRGDAALLAEFTRESRGVVIHLIDGTTDHDDDGKIVRVLDFTLERQTLHAVSPQGASPSAACAAFECVDGATLPASCIAECQRWRVPIVVELTQVEAFDRFGLCN